ncbi:hypothetical protein COHA_001914 [Chlorella ohadii]|uniref:Phospholipase A2 domain-containing protein n=1 Tax=Chlorella ohadii TaxID=2649997 RepID=A0AAD5DWY4_9CHLO|nr:hypothetical protein COHA_001914 [Chlorella ohadii]
MLAAPMATRENAFQSGAELAVDVAQELLGTCVWGNYCGGKCDGVKEGKEPLSTSEDGGLDQACYEHDRCLEENRDLEASTYCAASGTPNCFCDSQLASKAWDIYNSNKKDCALWDLTCWEYGFVMAARNVALSQEYRQYCGSCN